MHKDSSSYICFLSIFLFIQFEQFLIKRIRMIHVAASEDGAVFSMLDLQLYKGGYDQVNEKAIHNG